MAVNPNSESRPLEVGRPCNKVLGCSKSIAFRPTKRGRPVCLEVEPWDRQESIFDLEVYYIDEQGVAYRTSTMLNVPLFICHTSRPGHRHLARSGSQMSLVEVWASDRWKELKAWIWEIRDGMCERGCGRPAVDLHHKHYNTLGREEPEDVELLCKECHEQADKESDI